MEIKSKSQKRRRIAIYLIAGLLLTSAYPASFVIRQRAYAHGTEASSNARSFSFALLEFDKEFGSYPNDDTIQKIQRFPGTDYDLEGTSSNSAFRQIIAAGISQSEQPYYANTPGTMKPDGDIAPGQALKKGEVGFAYISGLSSKSDPLTPVAVSPLIPGTTKFLRERFARIAIVVHADGSLRSHVIAKDGHIYDKGVNLLSPKHPVWKGKAPDIRYPEL